METAGDCHQKPAQKSVSPGFKTTSRSFVLCSSVALKTVVALEMVVILKTVVVLEIVVFLLLSYE